MSRRIVLKVAYDGTNYHGWQTQENAPNTIQSLLEDAAGRVCNHSLHVHGAGRTDTGVHARAQICHITTTSTIPLFKLIFGMNSILPRDIRVRNAFEVDGEFHSQYQAHSKIYHYTIVHGCPPDPLRRLYSWHVRQQLDPLRLQNELNHYLGEQDFTACRAKRATVKTTVRTIFSIKVEEDCANQLTLKFHGSGFLKHMIRIMVGTAVDRVLGSLERTIPEILSGGDRTKGGRTAPSSGLVMHEVHYLEYDFSADFKVE